MVLTRKSFDEFIASARNFFLGESHKSYKPQFTRLSKS
jgi:hypothetical protein